MLLDDIIIRDSMKNANPPRENKYQNRLLFYREHGTVYKTIQVDENGMLLDGYISYLILKEYGIGECNVEVMTRTSEKHCTERISTEKDGR